MRSSPLAERIALRPLPDEAALLQAVAEVKDKHDPLFHSLIGAIQYLREIRLDGQCKAQPIKMDADNLLHRIIPALTAAANAEQEQERRRALESILVEGFSNHRVAAEEIEGDETPKPKRGRPRKEHTR